MAFSVAAVQLQCEGFSVGRDDDSIQNFEPIHFCSFRQSGKVGEIWEFYKQRLAKVSLIDGIKSTWKFFLTVRKSREI